MNKLLLTIKQQSANRQVTYSVHLKKKDSHVICWD